LDKNVIKLAQRLPRQLGIGVSGGVDSMAALDFLKRNHDVTAVFFHHGTNDSERASNFVADYCNQHQIPLIIGYMHNQRDSSRSPEEHWRIERYNFFDSLDMPIVTAHHLDDCVETYVWSSMHGLSKTIPLQRNHVIRPFLLTKKQQLQSWCQHHDVPWCEDQSNSDLQYQRNYIRHQVMPHIRHINPGIDRVVRRVVERQLSNSDRVKNQSSKR
jgi:tRNA(Ile)-lysidine synthase